MKPCGSNDALTKFLTQWMLHLYPDRTSVDVEEVDCIIMVCLHVFETKNQFNLHDKNTSTIN